MLDGLMTPLRRMLERRVDRDGEASALEAGSSPGAPAVPVIGRRDTLGLPGEMLDRALAQKVLHGWLQNRHQVLVPLTLRLAALEAGGTAVLMRFAAVALLLASKADVDACEAVRRWLKVIGADRAAIMTFEDALIAPAALSSLLADLQTRQLEAYGYAIAATAADLRTTSGRLFADYVAARLALPADAVRSINRRYRR